MGRNVPSYEVFANTSFDPPLTLALLAACAAATIAVAAANCVSRRKTPPSPPPPQPIGKTEALATSPAGMTEAPPRQSTAIEEESEPRLPKGEEEEEEEKVVVDVVHGPIEPVLLVAAPSASRRRLSMNLSVRLPEGLSRIRTSRRDKAAAAAEESVWQKTIILGERCRVPSEEEEEAAAGRGLRQLSYHPRTPRSVPASRANSFKSVDVPTA